MIVIDPGEPWETVKQFADQYNWTFDVLLDPDQRASRRYGVNSHPRTYLIDREGNLLGLAIGYRDWNSKTARQLVEGLIRYGSWDGGDDRPE
jgi:peroxiredoxin